MKGFIEFTEHGAWGLEELAREASLNMESLTNDTERFVAMVNSLEGIGEIKPSVIDEAEKVRSSIACCQDEVEQATEKMKNAAQAIREYLSMTI